MYICIKHKYICIYIESTIENNYPYIPEDKRKFWIEGLGGGIYLITTYATLANSVI